MALAVGTCGVDVQGYKVSSRMFVRGGRGSSA